MIAFFKPGRAVALCYIAAMALARPFPAAADDQILSRGRAELQRAIESLRPRPSLDTTPIEFSVGGIRYRMPRNYLMTMDNWNGGPQGLVTVQVKLPDLEPVTEETRACFAARPLSRPPECEPLSFTINAPGGPSSDEAFARMKPLFHNKDGEEGPFGYYKYEIGPTNARIEFYRKIEDGRTLLYMCQIFDNHGNRDGICDPTGDRLVTGAVIHFFFRLHHLRDIAQIDANLHKLIEGFTIKSTDEK